MLSLKRFICVVFVSFIFFSCLFGTESSNAVVEISAERSIAKSESIFTIICMLKNKLLKRKNKAMKKQKGTVFP